MSGVIRSHAEPRQFVSPTLRALAGRRLSEMFGLLLCLLGILLLLALATYNPRDPSFDTATSLLPRTCCFRRSAWRAFCLAWRCWPGRGGSPGTAGSGALVCVWLACLRHCRWWQRPAPRCRSPCPRSRHGRPVGPARPD